jgi:hypothetical protein
MGHKEHAMKERTITVPELALVAGTRFALGIGVGFLVADWLDCEQRRAVGWTLTIVGALSTLPLGLHLLSKHTAVDENRSQRRPSPGAAASPAGEVEINALVLS